MSLTIRDQVINVYAERERLDAPPPSSAAGGFWRTAAVSGEGDRGQSLGEAMVRGVCAEI